jgi:hypothetical protein
VAVGAGGVGLVVFIFVIVGGVLSVDEARSDGKGNAVADSRKNEEL